MRRIRSVAVAAALLLFFPDVTSSERQINGIPSIGQTIHYEQTIDTLSYDQATITVKSDIPVTVQRYTDGGYYLSGKQPLTENMAKILITSNCDTTETTAIPIVAILSDDGNVTIDVSLPQENDSGEEIGMLSFLEPSSYSAIWNWVNDYCDFYTPTTTTTSATTTIIDVDGTATPAVAVDDTKMCHSGSSSMSPMTCTSSNEYCQTNIGVCNDNYPDTLDWGTCITIPQFCTEEYNPVCGCDLVEYSNECNAQANGASISILGPCPATAMTTTPTNAVDSENNDVIICTMEVFGCSDGSYLSRNPELNCDFPECPTTSTATTICTMDVFECSDGSYLSRNPELGCAFPKCPITTTTTTAATDSAATITTTTTTTTTAATTTLSPSSTVDDEESLSSSSPSPTPSSLTSSSSIVSGRITSLCSSDADCTATIRSRGSTQKIITGIEVCGCYAASSITPFDECEGESDATCIIARCMNSCDGFEAYCAPSADGTDECILRQPRKEGITSTDASIAGPVESLPFGDDPSTSPVPSVSSSSVAPTPTAFRLPMGISDSTLTNSAFGTHSFSRRFAMTLLAIVVIFVTLQSNDERGYYLRGIGKFVVVGMALSSLYPRSFDKTKGDAILNQKSSKRPEPMSSRSGTRNLQTCTFNVEMMVDGCSKMVEIAAPTGRVVDSILTNQTEILTSDEGCRSTSDLSAYIEFSVTNKTSVLNLSSGSNIVEMIPPENCIRAMIGRPFVDVTGGTLQAMPIIVGGEALWTGNSLGTILASTLQLSNSTINSRYLLGEEWTQRALGEHSSVASFAAFTIALMTNNAPDDLVNDALIAGQDEMRHAKTSFKIVSLITGKDVHPGPLPPSNHAFRGDLRMLALSVAREGCVDETLSAIAAALEVEHINEVLNKDVDSLYSTIDSDDLVFIRDELVKIAMDESNHSALAWRTMNWVCTVDHDACESVYTDVFDESKLEIRFRQRAKGSLSNDNLTLDSMRGEWKKLFNKHRLALESKS